MKLPPSLNEIVGSPFQFEEPLQGKVAQTYFVHSEKGRWVLKQGDNEHTRHRLKKEHSFLIGFQPKNAEYGTPKVVAVDDEFNWLLLTWYEGDNFRKLLQTSSVEKHTQLVSNYGKALAWIHAQPVPKSTDKDIWLTNKLSEVSRNIALGWVDAEDFEPENLSTPIPVLKEKLLASIPKKQNTVLIHGDVASDNFIHSNGKITAIIDWSEAGYGDKHADLALAWREIGRLPYSNDLWSIFLEAYGDKDIDHLAIDFYLLLDEFM